MLRLLIEMNRDEAKRILAAHRHTPDESNDPEFSEAVESARTDPELGEWLAREKAFDDILANELLGMEPPADLKERILSGERLPSPPSRQHHWLLASLSLAAVIAMAAYVDLVPKNRSREKQLAEWQTAALDELGNLVGGKDPFDHVSASPAELQKWLASASAPSPEELPGALEKAASLGCKTIYINHIPVSIICFHATPKQLAHLVTAPEKSLTNPPPENGPAYTQKGEWMTASWSEHGQSFMLVMRGASKEELRDLLTQAKA